MAWIVSAMRRVGPVNLAVVLICAGLATMADSMTGAFAEERTPSLITMSGMGRTDAEPDLATLTAGVVTEAKTAREALTENTARMTAVIDGFKAAGIPEKDIQTRNFSVQPQYFYERTDTGSKPPRITAYQVSNEVVVVVRDLANLGDVLDRTVDVGAEYDLRPDLWFDRYGGGH